MRLHAIVLLSLAAAPALAAAPDPPPASEPPSTVVRLHGSPKTAWWNDGAFSKPIALVLASADLDTATAALAKASGLNLVVSGGGTKARKKVTLNLKDAPLRDVMLAIANLYELEWFQSGSVYVLTYVSASQKRPKFLPPSAFGPMDAMTLPPTQVAPLIPTRRRSPTTKPKVYRYTPVDPNSNGGEQAATR